MISLTSNLKLGLRLRCWRTPTRYPKHPPKWCYSTVRTFLTSDKWKMEISERTSRSSTSSNACKRSLMSKCTKLRTRRLILTSRWATSWMDLKLSQATATLCLTPKESSRLSSTSCLTRSNSLLTAVLSKLSVLSEDLKTKPRTMFSSKFKTMALESLTRIKKAYSNCSASSKTLAPWIKRELVLGWLSPRKSCRSLVEKSESNLNWKRAQLSSSM